MTSKGEKEGKKEAKIFKLSTPKAPKLNRHDFAPWVEK
jgi:hypothetical protein